MKAFLALLLGVFCLTEAYCQSVRIDNNVSSVVMDSNYTSSSFACSNRLNSDTFLIENLSLWIHAKEGSNEFLSIQNGINHNDFTNGINSSSDSKFSIIHKLFKPEIKDHQYLYKTNGYTVPESISLWPGSNDTQIVASFVDANQNNKYDPEMGDYPYIRGQQCLLKLSNDGQSRNSSLSALSIELAQYHFVFPKAGDPILDNAIGFRWVLKNNSTLNYDTVKAGIQFHGLLNSLNSNFIGTDVVHNAMYVHESNPTKKQFASVVLLNKTLSNTIYYKNEGISANKNDIPTQDLHYINYLESKWKDGDTLKLGSTGLDGDSSMRFAFPDNTLVGFSRWSEKRVGNQGGDRSGILGSEFYNWEAGSYQVLEGAILFSDNIDSLEDLYTRHAMLHNAYTQSGFTGIKKPMKKERTIVFPNPLTAGNIFTINSVLQIDDINIYSMEGKLVFNSTVKGNNVQVKLPKTTAKMILCHIKYKDLTSEVVKLNLK